MILKRQKFLPCLAIFACILFCAFLGVSHLVKTNTESAKAQGDPLTELLEYLQGLYESSTNDFQTLSRSTLAKAPPDECFFGIGDPRNTFVPTGIDVDECVNNGGYPKVNQAYVWGLAKSGDDLWFGTASNVHCLVIGGYLGITNTISTDAYVCEFGASQYSPPLPEQMGDARPLRIYKYNVIAQTIEDKTPDDPKITQTIGIRSAGTLGDIVFLAGPGFRGINIFAFNTSTGQYLGSYSMPGNNIRKWIAVNDVLYTAIGEGEGGKVIRWTGNAGDPFHFEEVGLLDSSGAELEYHEGRLFVSTWPGGGELAGEGGNLAGLYMSPVIPDGGLTSEHYEQWTKVWEVSNYEPDPVTAATYGGGALASYGGYLYWGTMHVPFLSTLAHFSVYGFPDNQEDILLSLMGTYRSISIFRGQNFETEEQNIELVYGMPTLPAYIPEASWHIVPNNMDGSAPLYGPSGFGNPFNNYTWTMSVYDDQLFVGTMDWSYLAFGDSFEEFPSEFPFECDEFMGVDCDILAAAYEEFVDIFDPYDFYGADLYRFSSPNIYALPESIAGVGNYSSYGIRTMISDDALYLGMANPMNMMTDLNDDKPEGGWELMCLDKNDIDKDGDGDCGDTCRYYHNPDQSTELCPAVMPQGFLGIKENDNIVIYNGDDKKLLEIPEFSDATDFTHVLFDSPDYPGALVVNGIILPEGQTKILYVPRMLNTNYVCVIDKPIVNIAEFANNSGCVGGVVVPCPGSNSNYTCGVTPESYKVEGLHHSGAMEIAIAAKGGSTGGSLPRNPSVLINEGEQTTTTPDVLLDIYADNAKLMAISNSTDFSDSSWEQYNTLKEWELENVNGEKTVYVKFSSPSEVVSDPVSDTIILNAQFEEEEEEEEKAEEEILLLPGGYLVKGPTNTIYYVYENYKYAFPNWDTFLTWYPDEYDLTLLTQAELNAIPDGNKFITYKPGVRMVKRPSEDPRTYAVDLLGTLRWITNEDFAEMLYGPGWVDYIDDLVNEFFLNYNFGENIDDPTDYDPVIAEENAGFIEDELEL